MEASQQWDEIVNQRSLWNVDTQQPITALMGCFFSFISSCAELALPQSYEAQPTVHVWGKMKRKDFYEKYGVQRFDSLIESTLKDYNKSINIDWEAAIEAALSHVDENSPWNAHLWGYTGGMILHQITQNLPAEWRGVRRIWVEENGEKIGQGWENGRRMPFYDVVKVSPETREFALKRVGSVLIDPVTGEPV